jgi:orotate phosphoribosyltransferase-like protein
MQRGLITRPPAPVKSMYDRVIELKNSGATHRAIASATGLAEDTVNHYCSMANKAKGVTRAYKKRGGV